MKKIIPFLFIILLAACKQNPPVNVQQEIAKADSLLKKGSVALALQAYDAILKTDSLNVYARLQKTLLLIQTNRYNDAIDEASAVIKLSDTAIAHYYRANALRFIGKYADAITDYTVAIKKQPGEYDYILERGMAYLKLAQYDTALNDFEAARSLDPVDPRAYLSLGSLYALKKENDKALLNYNHALMLKPAYYQPLLAKCILLSEMGQADSCLSTLYKAIDYFQDSTELYKMRLDLLFKKKNYEVAIIDAGVLIRLMPNKAPYYNVRGFCKLEQNKTDDALLDFERALQQDTSYAYAWNNRGYCRYLENDLNGAISDIDHSLRINPNNSFAYRNLALVQLAKGHKKEACKSLNMAIDLGFTKDFGNEVAQLKAKHCK